MRVDGHIFANEKLLESIRKDQAPDQVANVATLPGIQMASLAMPDIHWGYGFCIGGVCATDPDEGGVISPGGVGYDINCGVRLVKTNLFLDDVKPHIRELVEGTVPHQSRPASGKAGKYQFDTTETRRLMGEGPRFVVDRGLGVPRDLDHTEAQRPHRRRRPARGVATTPSSAAPSSAARSAAATTSSKCRSSTRSSTRTSPRSFGLRTEPGLRDDPLRQPRARLPGVRRRARASSATCPAKYGIDLPDRQLACAPVDTPGGAEVHRRDARRGQLRLLQPATAHAAGPRGLRRRSSAARGRTSAWTCSTTWPTTSPSSRSTPSTARRRRSGSTARGRRGPSRPGHPEVPAAFRAVGQPVIIPGDMGRASWVLVGQPGSMEQTFGTTCHGAGRAMSRTAASSDAAGRRIDKELEAARRDRHGRRAATASRRSSRRPTRTWTTSSTSSTRRTCRARSRGCGRSA